MKKKISILIKKLFQHELISGSSYFFIGSFVGNVLAFLFNLFLTRKLTTLDYGIYASLISFFSLAILIPQSFLNTIVQFATKYFSQKDTEKAKKLYWQTIIFLSLLGIVILVSIIFSARFIGVFLHITNTWLIISIGILIVTFFITSINTSYLQSLLQFKFISIIQVIGSIIKLGIGMVLVVLGFNIFGALAAICLSFIIPFFFSFVRLGFLLIPSKKNVLVPLRDIVTYALPSTVSMFALSSFISSDVILAKHFLSGNDAGLYAGLSLVGRVIFYFTGIVPIVMFPILVNRYTKGSSVHNTFYLGLLLVAIPSCLITIFYFLFPTFVITLFLGGRDYLRGVANIGYMALFLSMYSLLSIMVNFFLSLKQTKIVFPVIAMALLQIVCIYLFHKTILSIIIVSLCTSSLLILILILYYLYHHKIAKTYTMVVSIPQEV